MSIVQNRPEATTATTANATATTGQSPSATTTTTRRKRKPRPSKPHLLHQRTLRQPPWSYIHLQHLTPISQNSQQFPALDAVTAHLHITAALSQFLGLHGAATAFDILQLEGQDVWVRVASENRSALVAAAGGWESARGEGWRVKGWSSWEAGARGRETGQELFKD